MALSPTQLIIAESQTEHSVTDTLGRTIKFRKPGILDQFRLRKFAESSDSEYLLYLLYACVTTEVDGVPVLPPTTEAEAESIIERLANTGYNAIIRFLASGKTAPETPEEFAERMIAEEAAAEAEAEAAKQKLFDDRKKAAAKRAK
jgi:hypothetical protein